MKTLLFNLQSLKLFHSCHETWGIIFSESILSNQLIVVKERLFNCPWSGRIGEINPIQSEFLGVTTAPLKVVQQWPDKVSSDGYLTRDEKKQLTLTLKWGWFLPHFFRQVFNSPWKKGFRDLFVLLFLIYYELLENQSSSRYFWMV